MKLSAVLLCLLCVLSGCDSVDIHTGDINRLQRPVVVVSNDPSGGVLVRGAEGKLYLANYDTYLGAALKHCKPGDVIAPATTLPAAVKWKTLTFA